MKFPYIVVLVRHGQSTVNVNSTEDLSTKKLPNHRAPLTELGREQIKRTRVYLDKAYNLKSFEHRYVSTFTRTHETMDCLGPFEGPPAIEDARLDEHWKGIWHALGKDRAKALYPHESEMEEMQGFFHNRPLQGESGQDVECRVRSFLTDLRLNCEGERVLIAAHGRWIQFLRKVMLNIPAEQFTIGSIANASVTTLFVRFGKWVIDDYALVP